MEKTRQHSAVKSGDKMFSKILIANRGEIACRVIKSARKMGIATVAIYSDADRDALHCPHGRRGGAHIGPPPANQSYIVIDNVMRAIRATGAEAVHPGYGFLSENAKFAEALEKEGVAFIGPPKGCDRGDGRQDHLEEDRDGGECLDRAGLYGADRGCRRSGEDRGRDRLSGDDQGLCRWRRQGDADRLERPGGPRGVPIVEERGGVLVSATTASSSRSSSPSRAISKSRCLATRTATASI